MSTFPGAASRAQQPPGPEDEDPSLDEYDLYSLAHSCLGKVWPCHLPDPSTSTPTSQLGFLLRFVLIPKSFLTPLTLSAVLLSPGTPHTPGILEQPSGVPHSTDRETGIMTAPKPCRDHSPVCLPQTMLCPPCAPDPLLLLGCLMPPPTSPQPLAWFPGVGGRKGRTKREAAANTNRPSPGGHERKLVTKLQNTERKKRGARS